MGFLKTTLPKPPELYQCDDSVFTDQGDGGCNPNIAKTLCEISTWSYSDIATFQEKLSVMFPGADFMEISVVNDSLLVNAYAQIIRYGDTALVCFRGTELVNPLSWLVDVQAGKEKVATIVDEKTQKEISIEAHGGFLRNFRQVWDGPRGILRHLLYPNMIEKKFKAYEGPNSQHAEINIREIYITGHSLGGAMALLAGLSLSTDNDLRHLNDKLKGIYTFGQPMVTAQRDVVNRYVGSRLFRYVYWNDIVPHLPPLSVGDFCHVGIELRAFRNKSYEKSKHPITQVAFMVPTIPFALLDFVAQNVQWTRAWLKLPWSVADHIPYHYLAAFRKAKALDQH